MALFVVLMVIVLVIGYGHRINLYFNHPEKYREVVNRERERRQKVLGFGAKAAGMYIRHRFK